MLVLERRKREKIVIGPLPGTGEVVTISVEAISANGVRLGISAPRSIPISRPDRDREREREGRS